jgi:hypothetical protein
VITIDGGYCLRGLKRYLKAQRFNPITHIGIPPQWRLLFETDALQMLPYLKKLFS